MSFYRFRCALRGDASFQDLPHLWCDLGELRKFRVVAAVGTFDIRHVNNDRTECRKLGIVGIGSETLFASSNKIRKAQCLIVAGNDDEKGFSWFAEPTHLRFENIDINIWRRQYDSP